MPKAASRRSRPSRLRLPIARRRRLIASTRSSRSVAIPVRFAFELGQLLLGAQVDGAEALAVAFQGMQARLDLLGAGEDRVVLQAGELDEPGGRRVEVFGDGAGDLGEALHRGLEAGLRAGPRLARGRERFERGAGGAVGLGERGLALGETVGGVLALRLGGLDLRRAARGGARDRCPAPRARVWRSARARSSRSPRSMAAAAARLGALGPRADVGRDRLAPAAAQVGLVQERLERPARLRSGGAPLGDARTLFEEARFEIRRRRKLAERRLGGLDPACRLGFARRKAREALLQGRAA